MPVDFSQVNPLPEAVASLERREIAALGLDTAALEELSLAYRRRAFFSARVENERFLAIAKAEIQKTVNQYGINRDRASFVANLQKTAESLGMTDAVDPADRGTIRDISSRRRLELIYDIQTGLALGEARWRSGLDVDLYNAAPAQELVRGSLRREPRDWPARWKAAGGRFYDADGRLKDESATTGRMMALKSDDVWKRISRFGVPWSPFDFNSGMVERNVRRREAVTAGLVRKGERLTPPSTEDLDTEAPSVSIAGMPEETKTELVESLGDLAVVDSKNERLTLDETAVSDFLVAADAGTVEPRTRLSLGDIPEADGAEVEIVARDVSDLLAEKDAAKLEEWDELPGVLWMPDEVRRERDESTGVESFLFFARLFGFEWEAVVEMLEGNRFGRLVGFFRRLGK